MGIFLILTEWLTGVDPALKWKVGKYVGKVLITYSPYPRLLLN